MRLIRDLIRENSSISRRKWPSQMNRQEVQRLRGLTQQFKFSVGAGDLLLLENGWYVTHIGLIRLATRRRCSGIQVQAISEFSDALNRRYAFKATVYKSRKSSGFVGCGDADPSNVSLLVRGAEMRVAETRAVNRALRKAYGIGICSVEEIGSTKSSASTSSIPIWSSPTRLTSAALRPYVTLPASRSKASSPSLPSGLITTAAPCSANSTPISPKRRVQHETANQWFEHCRSL